MDLNSLFKINSRYNNIENDISLIFNGWVRRIRKAGNDTIVFIDLYDGTCDGVLHTVCSKNEYFLSEIEESYLKFDDLLDIKKISIGCSVQAEGKLVTFANATQKYELKIEKIKVIGGVENATEYQIQKSNEKNLKALRTLPFTRMKSPIIQSIFRVRSELLWTIHDFFHTNNILCLDPNILTSADCEGAGEIFKVSPQFFNTSNEVGLTVSSQLPLEALATGCKEVYTCQKSFRAEKSDTSKHLAEFLHIEYESYFISLDILMVFSENLIKHCIREITTKCSSEYNNISKEHYEYLCQLLEKPFVKITHRDAVEMIQRDLRNKIIVNGKRLKMVKFPQIDQDLDSEHEKYLTEKFKAFVFVTHWPLKIKSFYMEATIDKDGNNDGTCLSFDLLAPNVGEMIGGSMREWRYDSLLKEMNRREMKLDPLQWFLDLRKNGSAPHGGWGLGFDRFVMFLTGVTSVRDVIPFPVYYEHCPY